jgi:hypothetical protein
MWTAVYQPGSLILLVSPTLRQSSELLKRVESVYVAAGKPVRTDSESALQLELQNGSRILSLPGKEATVRGYSAASLLVLDEAAWIPDELYLSVTPMLAISGGKLICLSTPRGRRGFFWAAWSGPEPWHRVSIPATMCPRISPEFLASEQRAMGLWWFSQEYDCQFLDAETQPFSKDDIDRCFREDIDVWDL